MNNLKISSESKLDHYVNNCEAVSKNRDDCKRVLHMISRMNKNEQADLQAWIEFNFDKGNHKIEDFIKYFDRPNRKW